MDKKLRFENSVPRRNLHALLRYLFATLSGAGLAGSTFYLLWKLGY